MSAQTPAHPRKPVIVARNVWKLFGAQPEKYLSALEREKETAKATGKAQEPKGYEEIRADGYIAGVKDVSIDVYRGEMLVIMGLSGSGKSTLVRCFSRLHEITGGSISIDGQDLMSLSRSALIELRRNKMGMVFQSFGLLPHRTVLDNVAFPLEMRGQDKHARRKRALEVIKLVGLEGREDYFPRELSGGQQQRVGIARSLAIEPDIWFLDEPFSALDPLIRREMQDEFLRLQGMLGKTIVFITHDFDEALRLADRIAIMKDGAVEQCDTPAKIVMNPATEYVRKFTEEIDKARVVQVRTLMTAASGDPAGSDRGSDRSPDRGADATSGNTVGAESTVHEIARTLIADARAALPVADSSGHIVGSLDRRVALDVLLGDR